MKERILMIAELCPFPMDSGGKLRTGNLLIQLSQRFDVDYVCYSVDPVTEKQVEILKRYCKSVHVYDEGRPSKMKHLQHFLLGKSGIACAVSSKNMQRKINELAEANTYKFVWVERIYCFPYVRSLLKKPNRVPVILNYHDVDHVSVRAFETGARSLLRKVYFHEEYRRGVNMEREALKKVDRLLAVSENDLQIFQSTFPFNQEKWLCVLNGVDMSLAEAYRDRKRDDKTVIFVGSMNYVFNTQGIEWFLDHVWPTISRQCPDVQLKIAGSGHVDPALMQKAKNSSNARFLGYVDDINELYAESTLLVVPLLSGSGTRMKIGEALSFRLPVVSTAIGAEGLPLVNGKDILIADDPELFAQKVVTLLKDRELQEKIGENGYRAIREHYDWPVVADKMISQF